MNFLKKIAPFLSTALSFGGPVGAIAGKALSTALGTKSDANPDDLAAAIAGATPEQIAAIQKAEQDFQVQMKQLDIQSVDDLEKIAADDRANARNREIQVKDYTPEVGFYLMLAVFVGIVYALFKYPVPPENKAVIYSLVGSFMTMLIAAATYFYGTTRSSANKDKVLADIAKS